MIKNLVPFGFLALLFATPAPATVPTIYQDSQTDLAAQLMLLPDGWFHYMLTYGALDEKARGSWKVEGQQLLLTTEPAPKPTRFVVVSDTPTTDDAIRVVIDDPDMMLGSMPTVAVSYAGETAPAYLEAEEGGRLPIPAGKTVAALAPHLDWYPVPFERHTLTPGGHRIVFRFEHNDLGIAAFTSEPMAIEGDTFVLRRYDRIIRFRKKF